MFDTAVLFKLLKRDFEIYTHIRVTLDVLVLVFKEPRARLCDIKKIYPDITIESLEYCEKRAPEFLSLGMDDNNDEPLVFSKVLKRHFSSEMFRRKMMENMEIDNISLVDLKKKESLNVQRVSQNILNDNYNKMLPTRNYQNLGEVYTISKDLVQELTEMYPSREIGTELVSIYEYLKKTPVARKSATGMKGFVKKWISGDLLISSKQAKKKQKINADKFYSELRNNGI
jgi:hypothetical protein